MAGEEAKPPCEHSENHFPAQDDDYEATRSLSTPLTSSSNSECEAAPDHRAHWFYSPTKPAHIPTSNPTFDIELESDMQPSFQHPEDLAIGWAKALQAEVDDLSIQTSNKTAVSGEEHQSIEELGYGVCKKTAATDVVNNYKSVNTTKETDCMDEFRHIEDHFTDLHTFDDQISKQGEKVSFDLESHWTATEKTKPWWRSVGKDELASLVAQKSLQNLENCDLPHPRTKHHRKDQSACFECLDQDCFITSSFTEMQFSSLDGYNREMHPSVSMGERQSIVGSAGHSLHHQDHFSISRTGNEENNSSQSSSVDPSKAQLLEALCHSQTRAREAEKAAQEADTEKQHIASLFLRQASQLFAYKQWFQLLQLQDICLQPRNKDEPTTTTDVFSDVLPRVPSKDRQMNRHRNRRKKQSRTRCRIAMYDVAVAVGLSLAGAGLLLGWTTGWLVPIF